MLPNIQYPDRYLVDINTFSSQVIGLPLYNYQLRPLYPIIDSIRHRHGREYLLLFSRQSGKNEAVAHLLVHGWLSDVVFFAGLVIGYGF